MVTIVIILVVVALLAATTVAVRARSRRDATPSFGSVAHSEEVVAAQPSPTTPSEVAGATPESDESRTTEADGPVVVEVPSSPTLSGRLSRARGLLAAPLGAIRRRTSIDEAAFQELEELLILADVGLETTSRLLEPIREGVRLGTVVASADGLLAALRNGIVALFAGDDPTLSLGDHRPAVWLFVGVNGVGKTTTIGKLASREVAAGRGVVLAAGDTFRAAAAEQLSLWAEKTGASVIRGSDGADPSSVVFDAISHAAARGADIVMADSAGRLHTKVNLMEELAKVKRVADRPPGGVTETLLVLDATTGQNGLVQARQFLEAADVTGVVLTKLDGTAKGGIVCAIRAVLGLPIKLVGLGEGPEDLVEFDPVEFADALLT